MPYIDRNSDGHITGIYAAQQHEGQEFMEVAELYVPPLTYKQLRAAAYPPVTDGLDAMVKGGQALEDYKAACLAVKVKYPKV